jgi:malonate transporter
MNAMRTASPLLWAPNIGGLIGALLPVFFVLALGYVAGKRHSFDADKTAGLSKLALSFALPASLFVGMTDIPKELLLQQGPLPLALVFVHASLFLVAWVVLSRFKSVHGTPSIQPRYSILLANFLNLTPNERRQKHAGIH